MYNIDRQNDFIESMHNFLKVAEANNRNDFMCCPSFLCNNVKDCASSMTLQEHLFRSGLVLGYICWTKHEESGVIMEDDEEENVDNILRFPEYNAFNDTTMRVKQR